MGECFMFCIGKQPEIRANSPGAMPSFHPVFGMGLSFPNIWVVADRDNFSFHVLHIKLCLKAVFGNILEGALSILITQSTLPKLGVAKEIFLWKRLRVPVVALDNVVEAVRCTSICKKLAQVVRAALVAALPRLLSPAAAMRRGHNVVQLQQRQAGRLWVGCRVRRWVLPPGVEDGAVDVLFRQGLVQRLFIDHVTPDEYRRTVWTRF